MITVKDTERVTCRLGISLRSTARHPQHCQLRTVSNYELELRDDSADDVRNLVSLDDWQLKHPDQNLRGKMLKARDGHDLGRIEEMLADIDEQRIVALRLAGGRLVHIDLVETYGGEPVLLTD